MSRIIDVEIDEWQIDDGIIQEPVEGEILDVYLELVDAEDGQRYPVDVEPLRSGHRRVWSTLLRADAGWTAVHEPSRPMIGRAHVCGRLTKDWMRRATVTQGRVMSFESVNHGLRVRLDLDVPPLLDRPEFVPGSVAWIRGQLWVMDRDLPIIRAMENTEVEEHLLELSSAKPWVVGADRNGAVLMGGNSVRRVAPGFPRLIDVDTSLLTCGPLGVLHHRGDGWVLHGADGGRVSVVTPSQSSELMGVKALDSYFAVLVKVRHLVHGISNPCCLTFIGEDGNLLARPRFFSGGVGLHAIFAVSPDRSTVMVYDRLVSGTTTLPVFASDGNSGVPTSMGYAGDHFWYVTRDPDGGEPGVTWNLASGVKIERDRAEVDSIVSIPVEDPRPSVVHDESGDNIWILDRTYDNERLWHVGPGREVTEIRTD